MASAIAGRAMQRLSFAKTLSYIPPSFLLQGPRSSSSSFSRSRVDGIIKDSHGRSFIGVPSFCSMASPNKVKDDNIGSTIQDPLLSYPLMMIPPEAVVVSDDYRPFTNSPFLDRVKIPTTSDDSNVDKGLYYFLDPTNKKILKVEKKIPPWQKEVVLPDDSVWVGSSHGWVTFIHPRTAEIYLVNPLSPQTSPCHLIPLAPIETLPLITSASYYKKDDKCESPIKEFMLRKLSKPVLPKALILDQNIIKKVVLSAPPLYVDSQGEVVHNEECIVMMIYGLKNEGNLAFCRLGDDSWTTLDHKEEKGIIDDEEDRIVKYDDIVYSTKDKVFYACGSKIIEAWDLHNASSSSSEKQERLKPCIQKLSKPKFKEHEFMIESRYEIEMSERDYLVDCNGDLLVVRRFCGGQEDHEKGNPHMTFGFQVYKWVSSAKKWEELVQDIDSATLFVGGNHAVSLCATQFSQLRKNSIYFTDSGPDICGFWHCPCYDMGVYDLFNGGVRPINLTTVQLQNPIWVVPNFI